MKIALPSLLLLSCNQVGDKTREAINKTGEIAGKTGSEFVEGVSEGIDKSMQCRLQLSGGLTEKGISAGKFIIEKDSLTGKRNILMLYLIFGKDFNSEVLVKVFDKSGQEYGRRNCRISGKAGEAGYFNVVFDKRTDIESKSLITVD